MDIILNQKRQLSTPKAIKTKKNNSEHRERHNQILKVENEGGGGGFLITVPLTTDLFYLEIGFFPTFPQMSENYLHSSQ